MYVGSRHATRQHARRRTDGEVSGGSFKNNNYAKTDIIVKVIFLGSKRNPQQKSRRGDREDEEV